MPNAKKHLNQAYEESKITQSGKSKKIYWFILGTLAILFVISAVITQFLPIDEPPVQQNTWEGVTPGYKLTQTVTAQLGSPVEIKKLAGEKQQLSYKSNDFKSYYNEVVISKEGNVEFIKTPIAYDTNHTLTNYTVLYGTPDLERYASEISSALKAHVFLEEGLVIIANKKTDVVEAIWYFEPTTEDVFLRTLGEKLTKEPSQPEAFPGL